MCQYCIYIFLFDSLFHALISSCWYWFMAKCYRFTCLGCITMAKCYRFTCLGCITMTKCYRFTCLGCITMAKCYRCTCLGCITMAKCYMCACLGCITSQCLLVYGNIDQILANSLHRLLNCEIGGLDCHVITTEYRTRVGSIWSMFSYTHTRKCLFCYRCMC